MKKILILLAAICLCGCGASETNIPIPRVNAHIEVVEIEGHEYIVIGPHSNPRIIHAEHCSCKNK